MCRRLGRSGGREHDTYYVGNRPWLHMRMYGSFIEYHTKVCEEVTTEDGIGRN
jgi:hypothetical protein